MKGFLKQFQFIATLFAVVLVSLADAGTFVKYYAGIKGTDKPLSGARANNTRIDSTLALAMDTNGNVYFTDGGLFLLRKIDSTTNKASIVAGNSLQLVDGDGGPATSASISSAYGLWVGSTGDVFIADTDNYRIRKVSAQTGIITSIVGTGLRPKQLGPFASDDGKSATSVLMNTPDKIIVDSTGSIYYTDSNFLRKISTPVNSTSNVVTTITDLNAVSAKDGITYQGISFIKYLPGGFAFDTSGNILVLESISYPRERSIGLVRKVSLQTNIISTVAGSVLSTAVSANGIAATSCYLDILNDVAVDTTGKMYIAVNDRTIRMVDTAGIIKTVVGGGTPDTFASGVVATSTVIGVPQRLALDKDGSLYFTTLDNNFGLYHCAVKLFNDKLNILTGIFDLFRPIGIWVDTNNNLFIADASNKIKKIVLSSGIMTTIAGTGTASFEGNGGPATSAKLNSPRGVTGDTNGNLFITDSSNGRIRKVDTNGIISEIAGYGNIGTLVNTGYMSGAIASGTGIDKPYGIHGDTSGNIYFGDTAFRIYRISPSGIMVTVAGTKLSVFNGNNLRATSTNINLVKSIWINTNGDLYFAEPDANSIRMISAFNNTVRHIGGTADTYYLEGVSAKRSGMTPSSIWGDTSYNVLYYTDSKHHKVRQIDLDSNIVKTIVNLVAPPTPGDGPNDVQATATLLNFPQSIVADLDGNLLMFVGKNRIRKIDNSGIITQNARIISGAITEDNSYIDSREDMMVMDSVGNLYITLPTFHIVRKFDISTNTLEIFAGKASSKYSGENVPATTAGIPSPQGIWMDTEGNAYITTQNRVRRVDGRTNLIATFAGTDTAGDTTIADAVATSSNIGPVTKIAGDTNGDIYVYSSSSKKLRKINKNGIMNTIYTSPGTIQSLLVVNNKIFFGDTTNNMVKMLTLDSTNSKVVGSPTVVCGTGKPGFTIPDGGPATAAMIGYPYSLYFDYNNGDLYFADFGSGRVRKITFPTGNFSQGIITVFAGNGFVGDKAFGDVVNVEGSRAVIKSPTSLVKDPKSSNLYFSDFGNNKLKMINVFPDTTSQPTFQPTGPSPLPTARPSRSPTFHPTRRPSFFPTTAPSFIPTFAPTTAPTTIAPTFIPSINPSESPTTKPTSLPTENPTDVPTIEPTTSIPSQEPTFKPTDAPSEWPTAIPTHEPTFKPSAVPTEEPTFRPTYVPTTAAPSEEPSYFPSISPTTSSPSIEPTTSAPSLKPTTSTPSFSPTVQPSAIPTTKPSLSPATSTPTLSPTSAAPSTSKPSLRPTATPSFSPTAIPTKRPSYSPTSMPSGEPSSAVQYQVQIDCSQTLVGISKDTFLADNTSAIAFKATIASLIPGINPENVIINNVTEIVDPVRNRRFLLLKLISTTAGTAQIAIDYSLVFDVQNLGGNVSPIDALKKVNETLTNSITSGEFQQVLQNTAVSMNSAALTSVVPGSMSVSPTVTATVTRTPRPSTYPTVTPQDVSTNSNGDGKLSRDHLIMAIVIPISFVLVALMTAGVAYVLFNTYGMMLMFANTDGKTKKTSGSRGIPNREVSTVVSYDNIYGGDEEDDFNNKYTVVSISDVEATL